MSYDDKQVEALIEWATQAVADLRSSGYVITAAELDGAIINLRATHPVERRVEGRVVAATFNDDNVTLCVECPEDTEVSAGPCTITLHDAAREEGK